MKINKEQISDAVLLENTTVNLNSSMTATDIQALIDAQPKNLGGYTLTFQFADGTYTLDNEILFSNFYSGQLSILGNSANNTLSITKAVTLNFTGDTHGLTVNNSKCYCKISFFKIYSASTSNKFGIHYTYSQNGVIINNYIYGDNAMGFEALLIRSSTVDIINNMFGLSLRGISAHKGYVYSNNNDDGGTGNQPSSGLFALSGSIMKNGTQPAGSGADEQTLYGGVIR